MLSLMREIDTDSFDYPGRDQPWTAPDSWTKTRQFILNDFKDILTDASSKRKNGAELQTVEYVLAHTYGLVLIYRNITTYRERLVAAKNDKKPLFVPSEKSKKLRLPHMLPAVAKLVLAEFKHMQRLLTKAVDETPLEDQVSGSPSKAALKRKARDLERGLAEAEEERDALVEENDELRGRLDDQAKQQVAQ